MEKLIIPYKPRYIFAKSHREEIIIDDRDRQTDYRIKGGKTK